MFSVRLSTARSHTTARSRSTAGSRGLGSFRKPKIHSSPNPIIEHRIYGPLNLGFKDHDLSADQDLESGIVKKLKAKIKRCYERVEPDGGFCFGLLDPVSNIFVSHALAAFPFHKPEKGEKGEEEEVRMLPSEPIVRSIYQRSCDGLVAFLIALFPYLTNYRALWYLDQADSDPLVAARLIINHRGMERTFGFASDATVAAVEMALWCAAAAAQHPNPRQFALGWKLLSPFLLEVDTLLRPCYATQDSYLLIEIMSLLDKSLTQLPHLLTLEQSWEFASARLRNKHPEMPSVPRPTVRRMLLTTIHGYYLQALAYLPKDKLQSDYHHSFLHAGHCYGPLDPVSNIILNTLWYQQAYPLKLERKVEIKAISTAALLRIAVRSLYGLISFLCTRYPALKPDEAMCRLHQAGGYLQEAGDPSLDLCGVQVKEEEAYAAAAKAAHHPKPLQQAQFLGPSNSKLKALTELLMPPQEPANFHVLGYFLSLVASSSSRPQETTKHINVLGPWDYSHVMGTIDKFWSQHTRAVGMVKSAMDMYNNKHGVPGYELHVICGVNDFADGPVPARATPSDCCSHVNFLATKDAGTPPQLFFAECRNTGSMWVVSLCCPVPMPRPRTEQVRCFQCEFTGSQIVHPTTESFLGREREFEMMLGGGSVFTKYHTNDGIIFNSHYETLLVVSLEEDNIYRDYSCDDKVEEDFEMREDFY